MTELLQQAIDQVNVLPDSDQNAIAALMIQAITQQQNAIEAYQSKILLDQLSTTKAEIFSPKADQAAVQALSDLLQATKQSHHA
jgi:hypothetical protein